MTPGKAPRKPAQLACETFWTAVGAGPDGGRPDHAWPWAKAMGSEHAWEAVADVLGGDALRALESVVEAHERVMFAARIDLRRGDPGAAALLLGEQLDGYEGPGWDGEETGMQWFERARKAQGGGGGG